MSDDYFHPLETRPDEHPDILPETMIGLFVRELNAKLADQYRVLRVENERLRLRIKDLEINSPAQAALDEIKRLKEHVLALEAELLAFRLPSAVKEV